MKRTVLIIFLCFVIHSLTVNQSQGQIWKMKRYEVTAGLGPSFFFGDIGGFSRSKNILGIRDLGFSQIGIDFNINLKYRISRVFNARLGLAYALFRASDQRGSNESRGYAVSTSVFEPALMGEYYFIRNNAESNFIFSSDKGTGLGSILKALDFYVFAGGGGLYYNIKGNDNLKNHGFTPSGFTPVIPVGLGATLSYSPNYNFGVEFGGRYSFSDNLDGYTSQYSSTNDVYYFLNFTISYKVKTGAKGLPSFR
jgi:hypothetical protein